MNPFRIERNVPEMTQKEKIEFLVSELRTSYGLAPILDFFRNITKKSNTPDWGVFLINVETILRNRTVVENKRPDIESSLRDCETLAAYIASFCQIKSPLHQRVREPLIAFYFPNYSYLPSVLIREKLPSGTAERWEAVRKMEHLIQKRGYQDMYEGTQVCYLTSGDKEKLWPHISIYNDIQKWNRGKPAITMALMVSHVPLDFHLYRKFKLLTLVESHTGASKTVKQFGEKVFKNSNVPFNKYTHLLLGDKHLLRSQITTKIKKTVFEKAAKEHWNILPDKSVLEAIYRMGIVNPDVLIKPEI